MSNEDQNNSIQQIQETAPSTETQSYQQVPTHIITQPQVTQLVSHLPTTGISQQVIRGSHLIHQKPIRHFSTAHPDYNWAGPVISTIPIDPVTTTTATTTGGLIVNNGIRGSRFISSGYHHHHLRGTHYTRLANGQLVSNVSHLGTRHLVGGVTGVTGVRRTSGRVFSSCHPDYNWTGPVLVESNQVTTTHIQQPHVVSTGVVGTSKILRGSNLLVSGTTTTNGLNLLRGSTVVKTVPGTRIVGGVSNNALLRRSRMDIVNPIRTTTNLVHQPLVVQSARTLPTTTLVHTQPGATIVNSGRQLTPEKLVTTGTTLVTQPATTTHLVTNNVLPGTTIVNSGRQLTPERLVTTTNIVQQGGNAAEGN